MNPSITNIAHIREPPPASYTYQAAAKALGWRSDRRLRDDRKKGLLNVQVLGARTIQIKRHELVRYAREYNLTLPD